MRSCCAGAWPSRWGWSEMSTPTSQPFIEVRDPRTLKLVCRYNPQTREVETVGRGGDVRRGTLPPAERATAPRRTSSTR